MKLSFHRLLTALFVASVLIIGKDADAIAQDNSAPPSMHSMDQCAADHARLLDAELAGLKAGLKLTPDQEMLWEPFETAVREAAKMRMEHMHGMMERMDKMRSMDMGADMNMDEGHPMSPIDRLDVMATHLMQAGTALKKVADAAKPLAFESPARTMVITRRFFHCVSVLQRHHREPPPVFDLICSDVRAELDHNRVSQLLL